MHGINVAARTSDINLREQIALNVTGETMQDVMQAIAGALGAHWTRSGHIFILARTAPVPSALTLAGPFRRHFASSTEPNEPDSVFEPEGDVPTAVVSDVEEPSVSPRAISSTKHSSLLRLTPSGEWAVAEQWTSASKVIAHSLKPKLSIRQRKLLAANGSLSVSDLTASQVDSLGDVWPDGNYHVVSNGKTVIIRR